MEISGWASLIMHHEKVLREVDRFRRRPNTFSLGVCNGCQLMVILGWVGHTEEGNSNFFWEVGCYIFDGGLMGLLT